MVAVATASQGAPKRRALELVKCVTPEFRVSFPHVFKPQAFEGQEAKFQLVALFAKTTNLKEPANGQKNSLRGIIFAAASEKWGADRAKWPKNLRMPFRDGDTDKADMDGYAGHIFVSMKSKQKPQLINARKEEILVESDFYAGCYARAEVLAYAYDTAGNKGVGLALQNIQKLREGKPFSGRKNAVDVFDAVEDGSDDADNYGDTDTATDDDDGMGF